MVDRACSYLYDNTEEEKWGTERVRGRRDGVVMEVAEEVVGDKVAEKELLALLLLHGSMCARVCACVCARACVFVRACVAVGMGWRC